VLPATSSTRSSLPSATAAPGRRRVLLVDDEALLRQRLARALVRHGFEVVSVASVVAACHWLRHGEFDVVVTDVCLHDGTGFDVFAAARDARIELPVLFVGTDPGLPATLATPAGAVRYCCKTLGPVALVGAIGEAYDDRVIC